MPTYGYLSAILWAIYCTVSETSSQTFSYSGYAGMLLSTMIATCIYFVAGKLTFTASKSSLNIIDWSEYSESSKRHLKIISLIISPLSVITYILSLNYLDVTLSSAITATYPVVTIIMMRVLNRTKLPLASKLSVVLATIGSILVTTSECQIGSSSNLLVGLLLALTSSTCYAIEPYLIDKINDSDAISITYYKVELFARVSLYLLLPLFIAYYLVGGRLNIQLIPIILLLGAGVTMVLSYIYYFKSIKLEGLTKAVQSNISYPLFVLILQIVKGVSSLNLQIILGVLLIISPAILDNSECQEVSERL